MSHFQINDIVRTNTTAQGMIEGMRYRIKDTRTWHYGAFSYTEYKLTLDVPGLPDYSGDKGRWVTNLQLMAHCVEAD